MKILKKMIDPSKEVSQLSGQLKQKSLLAGKKVGKNNLPKIDSEESNPFVKEILYECEETLHRICSPLLKDLETEQTGFNQLIEEYKNNGVVLKIVKIKEELKEQEKEEKAKVKKLYEERRNELKEKKTALKLDQKNNQIELDGAPYYNVKTKRVLAFLCTSILLFGELFANAQAASYFARESMFGAFVFAFCIGLIFYFLGWGAAKSWDSDKPMKEKLVGISVYVGITIGLAYVMAILRSRVAEESSDLPAMSAFKMMIINIGFFVAIALVKRFVSPSEKVLKVNAEHKRIKKNIVKNEKNTSKIDKLLDELNRQENKASNKLSEMYQVRLEQQDTLLQQKYQDLKRHQVEYNKTLSRGIQLHKQLNALASECIAIYIQQINMFHKDANNIAMPSIKIVNPLENYSPPIHNHNIQSLFNTNLN
ncbi:hypothetical protein [Tenacibaculum halocynthiae]|uniref:hypothetical protein n=1 Tax=Tenacibaculum halocynthiae TaxID=1254437 RepID=UPI003D650BF1